jgi:tetratricopeptide (TPR) repeat protein
VNAVSKRAGSGFIWKGVALASSLIAFAGSVVGMNQLFFLHAVQEVNLAPIAAGSWQKTYDQGQSLYNSGKYDDAYKLWGAALKQAELEGADHQGEGVEQIAILEGLALLYKTQQQSAKAAQMYERAVSIATKHFGATSAQVAQLFLELGRIYTYSEPANYAKANEALAEAFRINEKIFGRDTIPTGDVAIALGSLKQRQNDYGEAIKYFDLAVRIGNLLEPNTIACCRIGPRQQLANCYIALGRYKEALAVDEELLEMARKGAPGMEQTIREQYELCQTNLRAAVDQSSK